MTALGFVGLGHMGGNMAARFLGAGYTVYGETRHRGEVQELEREGLQWRDTPREIAEAADVVVTSVPNDSVLEDVASGPDGILAGLAAGKVWVDMSTVSPHVSRDIAQRVREARSCDARRAGVGKRPAGAERDADDHGRRRRSGLRARRAAPARARHAHATSARTGRGWCSSSRSTSASPCRCSPSPKGSCSPNARASTRKRAVEVMTQSPIGSPMLKARADLVLDLPEEAWFDVGLMQKDIALALDAARRAARPAPLRRGGRRDAHTARGLRATSTATSQRSSRCSHN